MNIRRVSAKDYLQERKDKHTTLDLRSAEERAGQALDESAHLPVQELSTSSFTETLKNYGHEEGPVYLLCQSGKRADMAVEKLKGNTDQELVIIEGGLNAIKTAGGPVTSSNGGAISMERQVRIAAGGLVVVGTLLGTVINPWFYGLSAFVGLGLMYAGITNSCGMAMVLMKMPWNKVSN